MTKNSRIIHYDMMRGLAISLMIMANSVATLYSETPPLLMRLMGSFAAPSFMILAGMMLALAKNANPMRGFNIIAAGFLIDVAVWKVMPFVTFDVLYTIGLAIIVTAHPAKAYAIKTLWTVGLLFIIIGQTLQWYVGYNSEILDIVFPITDPLPPLATILLRVIEQFFISGWFPVFPWLGFVWCGAALQRSIQAYHENRGESDKSKFLLPKPWLIYALVVLGLAASYWASVFVTPETREGYSELFYPASAGFCFTAASAFVVMLYAIQALARWQVVRLLFTPLCWLGQQSLGIYVLHLVVIEYLLLPFYVTAEISIYAQSGLTLWVLCLLSARLLNSYPAKTQPSSVLILNQNKT